MFLLVCEPENSPEITTSPTSNCCTSGSYRGPTLFFLHITSGHNDLATEKKLSKFGTTLFGYLNSKVKVNDLYIFFYLNCHAMYISS